ncbi:T9SS type A sorting domain-containing protein [Crocinitomicaceae bacterium]|nr:T9SS type A sorting domain-containing protein [Crocinitomicaceae bacterium]
MKNLLFFAALALSINALGQVPNYVPTNSLSAWLGFDGNADDETGNGNNGIVNGATLTTDRFGNVNSAYSFDGNDWITIPNIVPIQNGTVAFWFETNIVAMQVLLYHANSAGSDGFGSANAGVIEDHTGISTGGNAYCVFDNSNGTYWEDFSQPLTPNNWFHMAVSYDGLNASIYLNGVLVNVMDISSEIGGNLPTSTYIGRPISATRFLEGKFDDLGIWNRVLNECEINELYNAQITIDNSITQNGGSLTATQTGATYQWIDCDNFNAPITGEVNQTFFPSSTGNYAVEVTIGDCSSTSECRLVDFTGIDEIESLISAHPNPTKDEITLSIGAELFGTGFVVTDNAGRIILSDTFKSTKQTVNLTRFDNGVYFIRTDNESQVKIIKQ